MDNGGFTVVNFDRDGNPIIEHGKDAFDEIMADQTPTNIAGINQVALRAAYRTATDTGRFNGSIGELRKSFERHGLHSTSGQLADLLLQLKASRVTQRLSDSNSTALDPAWKSRPNAFPSYDFGSFINPLFIDGIGEERMEEIVQSLPHDEIILPFEEVFFLYYDGYRTEVVWAHKTSSGIRADSFMGGAGRGWLRDEVAIEYKGSGNYDAIFEGAEDEWADEFAATLMRKLAVSCRLLQSGNALTITEATSKRHKEIVGGFFRPEDRNVPQTKIVHFNKKKFERIQTTPSPVMSTKKKAGHERRAHYRHYKNGTRREIKAMSINGGSKQVQSYRVVP